MEETKEIILKNDMLVERVIRDTQMNLESLLFQREGYMQAVRAIDEKIEAARQVAPHKFEQVADRSEPKEATAG